ncbi:MAG TPA: exosortase system-associated protein, TIGR04073 family [Geobacteraceae bacterium]|nr:exosortase system-associated protein, TIGR04073 family [Geobacteraceae bacterium]
MRIQSVLFSMLILFCLAAPVSALEGDKPENIVGKMAYKLTSGVTNIATSPAEFPKQCILSARDDGAVGYVIGPIKGVGMIVYRAFIGTIESFFFYIPQPGYYDPAINPDFVWNGWEKQRLDYEKSGETVSIEPGADKTGE